MTLSGMNIEEVEALKVSLQQQATNINGVITAIDHTVASLQDVWSGDDVNAFFVSWYRTYRPSAQAAYEGLSTWVGRLNSEVSQQQNASQAGPIDIPPISGTAGNLSWTGASVNISVGVLDPSQKQVAGQLMSYFMAAGLTKAGAAAVVGNWWQESSLNPTTQPTAQDGYAEGLGQWSGSRQADLETWANKMGLEWTSTEAQASFAMHELQNKYPALLTELENTDNAGQAAEDFERIFEVAGVPNIAQRAAYAQAIFNSAS